MSAIRYDWLVVGGGLTGSALAYELQQTGFRVLLLERHEFPQGATRFSYGGIPYWSGTTPLTQQLCQEGIELHRQLSTELEHDTEFRELPLLLTISCSDDPVAIAGLYANCAVQPMLLGVDAVRHMEPLIHPNYINGAVHFAHAHVNPLALLSAYLKGFQTRGGTVVYDTVAQLCKDKRRVVGVASVTTEYVAENVVLCAGGWTRAMLREAGIACPIYFTHAELLEIDPQAHNLNLQCMVMPADTKRYQLEADTANDLLWDEPNQELTLPSVDAGAVQLRDGTIRLGQLSRVLTDPYARVDALQSEKLIRSEAMRILPAIAALRAVWHRCLVAYSHDGLPLVGKMSRYEGLYLFSGFTSPMVYVPPLARRFAQYANGAQDSVIAQLIPDRYRSV